MKNFNHLILLFVLGLFSWLIAYPLMQDGMFTDGIQYAAVSRNLALGLGTFWDPHLSFTTPHFHQQPPLMMGLQSIFFKVIVESIYPERIYSLLMGIISLLVIILIWKQINSDSQSKQLPWLPAFLWLIIPTIPWGLINNVSENTMVVFDLLSVLFLIRFMEGNNKLASFILAVLFLFAASFTKGFQGLFPLVAPGCYWISKQNLSIKKFIGITGALIISLGFIYFILLLNPNARESYHQYFLNRLSGFPKTPHVTTENRFYLLSRLMIELSIPFVFSMICVLYARVKNFAPFLTDEMKRIALFFLLIGLAASLPLMISFEQRGFYLITSMPFFAMSLSILVAPSIGKIIENWSDRFKSSVVTRIVIGVFLLSGIIFTLVNAGKIKRDQDMLHDVYLLKNIIGINQNVSVSEKTWNNWALQNYFQRYDNISVLNNTTDCSYYLQLQKDGSMNLPGFQKVDIGTTYLDLYQKQ